MKRQKRSGGAPARRIAITFLLLAALAVVLGLGLLVWPRPAAVTVAEYASGTPLPESTPASTESAPGMAAVSNGPADERVRPGPAVETGTGRTAATARGKGIIAVIIDDAGNDLASLERFLAFPGALTVAVLPQLPYSTAAAKKIHESGKEVMLHLPLEPLGNENPGPGFLAVDFDRTKIRETLERDFASVPFARGVNNHMGSRATQDADLMEALFSCLRDQGRYFVDSRTTSSTLGREFAARFGVPMAERTYFLDNSKDRDSIARVLAEGVAAARLKGGSLLIGHVQNQAVSEVLTEQVWRLAATGIEFVTVSEFIRRRGVAK